MSGLEGFLKRLLEEVSEEPPAAEMDGAIAAARLAMYDSMTSAPRVVDLSAENLDEFIALLAARTYQVSRERGGRIPYTAIKEITENLIHALFREIVISVMSDGNTILISDRGPGIPEKDKAMKPGYSTATAAMKRHIRGVGSGLPVASEALQFLGGALTIDDNLGTGTVVTISLPPAQLSASRPEAEVSHQSAPVPLSQRQKKVLSLVMELGSAGPSLIASELGFSLSTAHREIARLENLALLVPVGGGKRSLSSAGVARLKSLG